MLISCQQDPRDRGVTVFVEVVGLELVGICIDKFGSENF